MPPKCSNLYPLRSCAVTGTLNAMSSMWRDFFDSQAATYEENPFTKNTVAEVDFLLSLYPLKPGASILDIGCGTGRHSIELAKRGYQMTGLDLSEKMLEVAKTNARELKIEWVNADARNPRGRSDCGCRDHNTT